MKLNSQLIAMEIADYDLLEALWAWLDEALIFCKWVDRSWPLPPIIY